MLLILREEIICTIILVYLIAFYRISKIKDKEVFFLTLSSCALAHIAFDMITVFTVNNRDIVPAVLNDLFHIGFYITGILVSLIFYMHIVNITALVGKIGFLRFIGVVPFVAFCIAVLFIPMEYVHGNGTDYSFGLLAIIGYSLFILYCVLCVILVIVGRHRLDRHTRLALLPMIGAMCVAIFAQALIPELLMTGANATFICLGVFTSLDNPDKAYRELAHWDHLTGLKNRTCYKRDMTLYKQKNVFHRAVDERRIGFVVADLNNLKTINDTCGHVEGDKLIIAAANALHENLRSAESVYRLGGDEFIAIYLSPNDIYAVREISATRKACSENHNFSVPLSIAMGYSCGPMSGDIDAILAEADRLMYANKASIKEQESAMGVVSLR